MDKKKKSPRKPSAPKLKDLDVQQRKLALIKQKQCDIIALNIVSKLIECRVEEDVFIRSLKYLNQCHYQDIVEERAITKLCGYAICGKEIKDMPNKKYHISTKSNKVYDITDRKNYCSNFCYKAGIHIKSQMLSSPLWFRDKEEIPRFRLLPKTENGIPGEEINQGIIKIDKIDVEEDKNFTSISQFTEDVMNDIPETVYDKIDIENNIQQNENTQKLENETNMNSYFSNIYGVSIADILKENAEYFEERNTKNENNEIKITQNKIINSEPSTSYSTNKKTKIDNNIQLSENVNKLQIGSKNIETKITQNEIINSKLNTSSCSTNKITKMDETVHLSENINKLQIDSKNIETIETKINQSEIINAAPSTSSLSSCKIGFDRTLINTNPKKSKGILKKTSNKSNKKRVSFSAEHSVKEIDNIPGTKKIIETDRFKKPEQKNSTQEKKYKNENLIGLVQERSTIFKKEENFENEQRTVFLENQDFEERERLKKSVQEINNKINSEENIVTTNKDTEKEIQESNPDSNDKKSRLSRLRNSSTYKRSIISKPKQQTLLKLEIAEPDFQTRLNTCISEWFTFETTLFLYGEEYVKKTISDKSFKQFMSKKKTLELDENKQKQYDEICKRLNLMELADQKLDEKITGKKRRPLPRYDSLKQQAEDMDLKVQAFYSGCYEVFEEDVTDTDTDVESGDEGKSEVVQGPPAVLPLVENKDLMAIRKKIFQTCISRSISTICEILQESPNRLLSEIKQLINTFEFTANNIVFKTNEWSFVTLFLIQILSIKDKELQVSLATQEANVYLTSLAEEFNFSNKYIEEYLLKKTQIQNLLDECMRKDCVS